MKRPVHYVIFGVAVYIFAVIATLPVGRVYDHLLPYLQAAGVQLDKSSLEGSVWSGSARPQNLAGLPVENIQWDISPFALLIGRLSVDWQLQLDDGSLQGTVRLGTEGVEALSDLQGTVPVSLLSGMMPALPIIPAGEIILDLDFVSLQGGKPIAAEGNITWSDAVISSPMSLTLGELSLDLTEEDGNTVGKLNDAGGPLELSGDLSITAEGAYTVDLKMAARDKSQQNLVQALAMMGKADADGRSSFEYSGKL